MDSGANRRGFNSFMKKHVWSCDVGSFWISETVDVEGEEE